MNTGESKRPSLVSGPRESAAAQGTAAPASPARILADMEQRKPQRAPRRGAPVLLVGLLGCALLLGGVVLFSGPEQTITSAGDEAKPVIAQGASQPSMDAASGSEAAVIVDDPGADPFAEVASGPASVFDATSPLTTTSNDLSASVAGTGPVAPGAAIERSGRAPQVASRTVPARSDRSRVPRGTRTPEPDLLATLLSNIGGYRPSGVVVPASSTPPGSPIDALVAQIQNNRDENYTPSATALSTIGSSQANGGNAATTAARSQSLQAQLRECPKANTVGGLACRQRVCTAHAGNDAACPR